MCIMNTHKQLGKALVFLSFFFALSMENPAAAPSAADDLRGAMCNLAQAAAAAKARCESPFRREGFFGGGERSNKKKKQPKTRRKNIKPTARDSGMEIIIVWGHPLAGGKISMKGS